MYSSTGTQWDLETSGCYYRHRVYHAGLGRFGSRDQIGYNGSEASLYEYVRSQPTISQDAMGLLPFPWWEITSRLNDAANSILDGFVFCHRGSYADDWHMCWDVGCCFDWRPMAFFQIIEGDWIAFTAFSCDELRYMVRAMPGNRRRLAST